MTTTEMPAVSECTVTACSYNNHEGCHAFAITVSGSNGAADCAHNVNLECTASAVRVGPGQGDHAANCLTYSAR